MKMSRFVFVIVRAVGVPGSGVALSAFLSGPQRYSAYLLKSLSLNRQLQQVRRVTRRPAERRREMLLTYVRLSLCALLVFAIFNSASSQTGRQHLGTGRIDGLTMDLLGISVPRAIVKFESETLTRETVSDESGKFLIDLPAAVYRVTVQKFGIYDPYQGKKVKVRSGKTKKLEIELTFDLKKYPPVI